ncbi:MAG: ThuA domain-containing protein [Micromonosporaceae bacterium]|nr:ThuA domain-containing protein [Micromonosporaceae bacterium]
MASARILVLAGRGRYEDPWHDHPGTSARIATILAEQDGWGATVRGTFPDAFGDLAAFDLVVVNAGRGRVDPGFDGDDATWLPAHESLRDYVAAGGRVLGVHQSANAFTDSPYWRELLGGAWIPGVSWHPPLDEAVCAVVALNHPVVAGLAEVRALDERYCGLELRPGSTVLLTQREGGVAHPVAWLSGAGRVGYDALGHDLRSYDSPSRIELLRREVGWLLRQPDEG